MERYEQLDVVVNNAGIGVIGPVEDVTEDQTRKQFEVNVFGVINVFRVTAPIFRQQRRGLYIQLCLNGWRIVGR
ncbi:MAG: SDR family NAD(P)-dependent oxidoreductase [Lyngbya sp. HA4199-MV5]|nr:SDR family NAD(P)-dependent oxidoreductase [Lyngbya sp. HA4199-MV5]